MKDFCEKIGWVGVREDIPGGVHLALGYFIMGEVGDEVSLLRRANWCLKSWRKEKRWVLTVSHPRCIGSGGRGTAA